MPSKKKSKAPKAPAAPKVATAKAPKVPKAILRSLSNAQAHLQKVSRELKK